LIVAKNRYSALNYYGHGNNAYDYRRYEEETPEEYKKIKNNKMLHKIRIKKRFKLISSVLLILCTGMLIVGRYSLIMNLSGQNSDIKNTLAESQKNNEILKVNLLKYYDIKQIEKTATSEIKMVRPDNNSIVRIDISDNNESEAKETESKPQDVSFIGRIINFFN